MNIDEVLKKFDLDFSIEKHPLYGRNDNGDELISPYFGLYNSKTNECINTCKANYTVTQTKDVIEMVMQGITKFGNDLTISKAGSIHGGRRIFLQLEINGYGIVGHDKVTQYVTIIDSNDGSTSLSIGIGDTVMHCQNQFFNFYKSGEAKFRHTATLDEKIKSVPKLIELALNKSINQIGIYKNMINYPIYESDKDNLVKLILGTNRLDNLKEKTKRTNTMVETLYNNIDTEIKICGMNVWGLFNGVTRYTTHHQPTPKRINGKDESLLVGASYKKAIEGFEYCSKLALNNIW